MSKNNKNIAEQAIFDMEKIQNEVKESSKDIISTILSEAARNVIREKLNEPEAEDEDEKDYEVLDAETDSENEDGAEEGAEDVDTQSAFADEQEDEDATEPEEGAEEETEADGDEDEWSEFEDYKVGDNEYDFTGEEDDEKVVKVYKLLKDTDNVVVKKDGEKVKIQDNETGAEYVIDLEDESDSEETSEPVEEGCIKEEDKFPEEQPDEEIDDPYAEDRKVYDTMASAAETGKSPAGIPESKKTRKTMKENKETIFEIDLGYTDNYQDKDPIDGLKNNEPSKSGETLDDGIPTDTKKPWAGNAKGQSDPYGKTVTEEEEPEEEAPVVEEAEEEIDEHINPANDRHMGTKKRVPNNPARKDIRKKKHVASTAQDGYVGTMGESIENDLKKALKENKEVKEALLKMKSALQEALLVNVNLGQFVKLVTENTTSQAEKVDILNRFNNEAKTVAQSKALYESIQKDLNKEVTTAKSINESVMAVNESKANETEIYQSKEMIDMIDLMKRMSNC